MKAQITPVIKNQIIALWSLPAADGRRRLTQQEIADRLGVSRKSVVRVIREFKAAATTVQQQDIEEYRRVLAARLPIQDRAARLVELILQNKQLKVALDALIRFDHLQGLHTEVELRDKDAHAPQPAPLFTLPPGTQMVMTRVEMTTPRDTTSSGDTASTIDAEAVDG